MKTIANLKALQHELGYHFRDATFLQDALRRLVADPAKPQSAHSQALLRVGASVMTMMRTAEDIRQDMNLLTIKRDNGPQDSTLPAPFASLDHSTVEQKKRIFEAMVTAASRDANPVKPSQLQIELTASAIIGAAFVDSERNYKALYPVIHALGPYLSADSSRPRRPQRNRGDESKDAISGVEVATPRLTDKPRELKGDHTPAPTQNNVPQHGSVPVGPTIDSGWDPSLVERPPVQSSEFGADAPLTASQTTHLSPSQSPLEHADHVVTDRSSTLSNGGLVPFDLPSNEARKNHISSKGKYPHAADKSSIPGKASKLRNKLHDMPRAVTYYDWEQESFEPEIVRVNIPFRGKDMILCEDDQRRLRWNRTSRNSDMVAKSNIPSVIHEVDWQADMPNESERIPSRGDELLPVLGQEDFPLPSSYFTWETDYLDAGFTDHVEKIERWKLRANILESMLRRFLAEKAKPKTLAHIGTETARVLHKISWYLGHVNPRLHPQLQRLMKEKTLTFPMFLPPTLNHLMYNSRKHFFYGSRLKRVPLLLTDVERAQLKALARYLAHFSRSKEPAMPAFQDILTKDRGRKPNLSAEERIFTEKLAQDLTDLQKPIAPPIPPPIERYMPRPSVKPWYVALGLVTMDGNLSTVETWPRNFHEPTDKAVKAVLTVAPEAIPEVLPEAILEASPGAEAALDVSETPEGILMAGPEGPDATPRLVSEVTLEAVPEAVVEAASEATIDVTESIAETPELTQSLAPTPETVIEETLTATPEPTPVPPQSTPQLIPKAAPAITEVIPGPATQQTKPTKRTAPEPTTTPLPTPNLETRPETQIGSIISTLQQSYPLPPRRRAPAARSSTTLSSPKRDTDTRRENLFEAGQSPGSTRSPHRFFKPGWVFKLGLIKEAPEIKPVKPPISRGSVSRYPFFKPGGNPLAPREKKPEPESEPESMPPPLRPRHSLGSKKSLHKGHAKWK
ncbi:uncharacterized protein BP01DRAFT_392349 [Aspergillus saccharolyticus JOP 1030-1]|uniref:Uncharacterized protein n=1 Tax=Aspergillus saccharolyticus JOP 1030-1 TaxID=1450539 RepID=A0A318ZEJ5_9EURO|nr:hypothetical protein BP01DRAFT_392349 [Aspergillus saccharolyticus JOP 1030-1]PYH44694.1 hypothetical protein BP01DRAFT_392349 [Aspergillus saccharolyticus JOP 1030-1]